MPNCQLEKSLFKGHWDWVLLNFEILIIYQYFTLILHILDHGCARVAHCVTARRLNFSHYCRPLRQYDVWFTCSVYREALPGAPTANDGHKQEFTVQGGKYIVPHSTSREASLRHSSGWGTWSFSPQYRDLRTRVLEHPSAGSSFLAIGPVNFFSSPLLVPALFFLLTLFLAQLHFFSKWI